MKNLMKILPMILIATFMMAQPRGKMMNNDRPGMQNKQAAMDLSDEQMKSLQDLRLDHEKAVITLRADKRLMNLELRELIAKGASKKDIDKKQTNINKTHAQLMSIKNAHLVKVRAVVGEDNFLMMRNHFGRGNDHGKKGGCSGCDKGKGRGNRF